MFESVSPWGGKDGRKGGNRLPPLILNLQPPPLILNLLKDGGGKGTALSNPLILNSVEGWGGKGAAGRVVCYI